MGDSPTEDYSSADAVPKATTSVVIPLDRFYAVPRKRAWYIGLYIFSFLLWAYIALSIMRLEASESTEAESLGEVTPVVEGLPVEEPTIEAVSWPKPLRVASSVVRVIMVLFYFPFVSVLRTMGYPWIAVFALCGFALAPIPGLLVVAYMDTRIGKAWNAADQRLQEAASA